MVYQPIKEGSITREYKKIVEDLKQLAIEAEGYNKFSSAMGHRSFDADVLVVNYNRMVAVFRKNEKVIIASADIRTPFNYNLYIINHIHYYELPVERETIVEHFNLVINEYLVE